MDEILTIKEIASKLYISYSTANIYICRSEFNKFRFIKSNKPIKYIFTNEMKERIIQIISREEQLK